MGPMNRATTSRCESPALNEQVVDHFQKLLVVHRLGDVAFRRRHLATAGDEPLEYLKFTFTDCIVTSYQPHSEDGETPTEIVEFDYRTVKMEYIETDPSGKAKGKVESGWDFETGRSM